MSVWSLIFVGVLLIGIINCKGKKESSSCSNVVETEKHNAIEHSVNVEDVANAGVNAEHSVNVEDDVNAEGLKSDKVIAEDMKADEVDNTPVEDVKPDLKPAIAKRGRKGRRAAVTATQDSQVVEVVKLEEGEDVIVLRCRPSGVLDLYKKLSEDQKQAVESIGFGNISLIKLSTFPTEMIRWLCSCFDPATCIFNLPSGRNFQLTAADVYDVFMIPMGTTPVPISLKKQNSDLKTGWRNLYGSKNLDISVPLL